MHHVINEYQLRLDVQRLLRPVYYIYASPLSCILGCNKVILCIWKCFPFYQRTRGNATMKCDWQEDGDVSDRHPRSSCPIQTYCLMHRITITSKHITFLISPLVGADWLPCQKQRWWKMCMGKVMIFLWAMMPFCRWGNLYHLWEVSCRSTRHRGIGPLTSQNELQSCCRRTWGPLTSATGEIPTSRRKMQYWTPRSLLWWPTSLRSCHWRQHWPDPGCSREMLMTSFVSSE